MRKKIDYIDMLKKVSPYNIKKGILYFQHYGAKGFWVKLTERFQKDDISYQEWYLRHMPGKEELERQSREVFVKKPLISILVPVYNTPIHFLADMISSVRQQSYPNWELCIANANPSNQEVRDYLKEICRKDNRIRVKDVPENEGIAQNTNAALSIASGEYIGFLDHDDLLTPDALYEVVKHIEKTENVGVIYSDEDKITADSKEYFAPYFKPDFNLDLLRSNNYFCHFVVAKKDLILKVGKLRGEFNGAQDYDLVLRLVEEAESVGHIPRILYHWRVHKESTADNPMSKMYAYDAGKKAIEDHLIRCGAKAEVFHTKDLGFYRVKYILQNSPLVSILIPNKDQADTLRQCVQSIIEKTEYPNYEIIVIENNSEEEKTFSYYNELEQNYGVKVVRWKGEFNYSAINNFGVSFAKGEYLLFLNNDIEVIDREWLGELLANCERKEVGIVGAKLYYPDDTVQHAGIVVGIGGIAGNMFVGLKRGYTGYMHKAVIQQNLSAVTAACMLMKRHVFEEVGGFEEKLKVAFNDVDLCLKVRKAGYLVVFDPYAELYHYESKSRGAEDTPEKIRRFQSEIEFMRCRWIDILKNGDPMYNCNLSLKKWDYSLKGN